MGAVTSRLALGTAQLAGGYGVAPSMTPAPRDVAALLDVARECGIDTIDTAAVYGDAESLLGSQDLTDFRVVTKLPSCPRSADAGETSSWVSAVVERSRARLRLDRLDCLLLHDAADLRFAASVELIESLQSLQASGVVRALGVSCYDRSDAELASRHGIADVLQVPLNVLDRRFKSITAAAGARGDLTEWHARSVFLQGLLLATPGEARARLGRAYPALERWHQWCTDQRVAPGHAALAWVLAQVGPRRVVVGVNGVDQLRQVARWADEPAPSPPDIATLDGTLIDPRRWPCSE